MSALEHGRRRVGAVFAAVDAHPGLEGGDIARVLGEVDVVYFVQAGEDGPIKIGKTTRDLLEARVAALQTGNPYPLRLIGVTPGGHALERTLHALFGHLRMAGEWFYPEAQLLEAANVDPLGLL